ncbi:MAG: thioesterase [Lysobacteraceae bacterium]|nr:MAG: thioesterase [Xanthomonadaceae bacterium]
MDLEARVRASFDRQGFMHTLGAELTEVSESSVVIRAPFSPGLSQQHGFFHGGVTATLADNAAGFAALTTMTAEQQPLSVEFKINLLAPAAGEYLEACGRVLRSGYRVKHCQAEVHSIEGEKRTLVAVALATIAASRAVYEQDSSLR